MVSLIVFIKVFSKILKIKTDFRQYLPRSQAVDGVDGLGGCDKVVLMVAISENIVATDAEFVGFCAIRN